MKRASFWPLAVVALLAFCFIGIAVGSEPLAFGDVMRALNGTADTTVDSIVRTLRAPRVVLACLLGAGLAASGGALQGAMRNPLAEPYLLGVSGGAAVGAVLAVTVFAAPLTIVPVAAFLGSVTAVACVLLVARAAGGRSDPRILLMAGVVIGAFGNASIMVLLTSVAPEKAHTALWWMMGSAAEARWNNVAVLAVFVLIGLLSLVFVSPEIDALALGDDSAAALGVDIDRATWRVFLIGSLLAAATVAAAGLIGFVGLVVPHIVRAFGIRRHREMILGSALAGAALVVAADMLARTIAAPRELPLGAVTALIGVPFFLIRLRRTS